MPLSIICMCGSPQLTIPVKTLSSNTHDCASEDLRAASRNEIHSETRHITVHETEKSIPRSSNEILLLFILIIGGRGGSTPFPVNVPTPL